MVIEGVVQMKCDMRPVLDEKYRCRSRMRESCSLQIGFSLLAPC